MFVAHQHTLNALACRIVTSVPTSWKIGYAGTPFEVEYRCAKARTDRKVPKTTIGVEILKQDHQTIAPPSGFQAALEAASQRSLKGNFTSYMLLLV